MVDSMLPPPLILKIALLAWLGFCVFFDLCSRLVPWPLTVIPLILAVVWRLTQGGWQMALLVVALTLVSDLPRAKWRIPAGCCASIVGLSMAQLPGQVYAMLVVFVVWALWEIGATGGADAKIIITLVLLFADGLVLVPIVLTGGIQGLAALIAHRRSIPYTVAIAVGTGAWLWIAAAW